jgi:hypothetical protein
VISPFALAADLFASFDIANGDLRPKRRHRVEPGSSAPVENHGALRVIRDQAIRDERAFASAVENCPEAKLEEISRIITCVSSKGSRMSFARMLRTEGRG